MKRLALAATLLALAVGAIAQQSDREKTEALARRAGDRLLALQQEADRLTSEERSLLGDLRQLEVAREIKLEELHQVTAEADDATRSLAAVNEQVGRLEREDVEARPELEARLVELYKLGRGRYVRLLLSLSDVRSVGQASRLVAALAKRDRDRIAAHERTLAELRSSRATLEKETRTLATLRVEAERAQNAADRAVQARNQLIRNIDTERDLNAQLSGELQAAQQKLQATLRQIGAGTPPSEQPSLPIRPFRGDLDWPLAGAVRQRFAAPAAGGGPTVNGIQIDAEDGATARAVHEGTVAFAGPFAGLGNLVIVQHDPATFSLYGNLSDLGVARGARVERGQALGTVGASPTGPTALYFELRVDGQAVDPLQWLKKR